MALVSDSIDFLDELLKTLNTTCSRIGPSMSTRKLKILVKFSREPPQVNAVDA